MTKFATTLRMRRDREADADALATAEQFARLSTKKSAWFWPTVAAALVCKHHWLVIACDSCENVVDLDLRVKPRDLHASIHVTLCDV